eukprot:3792017-Rhodomonas_salina.1
MDLGIAGFLWRMQWTRHFSWSSPSPNGISPTVISYSITPMLHTSIGHPCSQRSASFSFQQPRVVRVLTASEDEDWNQVALVLEDLRRHVVERASAGLEHVVCV